MKQNIQVSEKMKQFASLKNKFHKSEFTSLCASPTFPVELKLPVEMNSFSDASRVCEPANESLF